ncbi:hypothetical protein ALC56_09534, partial [Trachymyrmex septentrionalis]
IPPGDVYCMPGLNSMGIYSSFSEIGHLSWKFSTKTAKDINAVKIVERHECSTGEFDKHYALYFKRSGVAICDAMFRVKVEIYYIHSAVYLALYPQRPHHPPVAENNLDLQCKVVISPGWSPRSRHHSTPWSSRFKESNDLLLVNPLFRSHRPAASDVRLHRGASSPRDDHRILTHSSRRRVASSKNSWRPSFFFWLLSKDVSSPFEQIARPSSTAATMEEKLSSANTISEADFATAVPEPIAIPISAFFKAGASFTPSPVCGTGSTREKRRALAQAAFCSDVGRSSNSRPEYDLPMVSSSSPKTPIRRQIASAVDLLSPVITITRMPAARHLAIESNTSLRGGSSMPTTPMNALGVVFRFSPPHIRMDIHLIHFKHGKREKRSWEKQICSHDLSEWTGGIYLKTRDATCWTGHKDKKRTALVGKQVEVVVIFRSRRYLVARQRKPNSGRKPVAPAAAVDVVVAFLRLTFEFEELRVEEGCREKRKEGETVPSDLNVVDLKVYLPYFFSHRPALSVQTHSLLESNERIIISPGSNGLLRSKCKHLRDANENTGERDGAIEYNKFFLSYVNVNCLYCSFCSITSLYISITIFKHPFLCYSLQAAFRLSKQTRINTNGGTCFNEYVNDVASISGLVKVYYSLVFIRITRATPLSGLTRILLM